MAIIDYVRMLMSSLREKRNFWLSTTASMFAIIYIWHDEIKKKYLDSNCTLRSKLLNLLQKPSFRWSFSSEQLDSEMYNKMKVFQLQYNTIQYKDLLVYPKRDFQY